MGTVRMQVGGVRTAGMQTLHGIVISREHSMDTMKIMKTGKYMIHVTMYIFTLM